MKILHVYKTYYPYSFGGVESFIKNLTQGLKKINVQSSLLCMGPGQEIEEKNIDGLCVYYCPTTFEMASTPFSIKSFSIFSSLIDQHDVIHFHFPYPFSDILHLTSKITKPALVTYHSDIIKQKYLLHLYKPLMNRFLSSMDKIVSTSPQYIETSSTLQKFKNKTAVVPIGINIDDSQENNPQEVLKYKEKFGNRFFLFIGVLRYYKGLQFLIKAAKNTDIVVVIAGKGPMNAELKEQAKHSKNIRFISDVSDTDKVNLLNACYGFVFPSHLRSEAFGISLLEAAMYKKPLISCEIGTGTSYINVHKETGLVVPPCDFKSLRQAMMQLIKYPSLASKMGENAYNRYKLLFRKEIMVEKYYNLYKEIQ